MDIIKIIKKSTDDEQQISAKEAIFIYKHASLAQLMAAGNQIRKNKHPKNIVTWIIDRNVNITNVCISFCKFCNFCRRKNDPDAYITSIEEYKDKIEQLFAMGGNQLLLQGGLHPDLGLKYYIDLFTSLKNMYPDLKLHALSPSEIVYIAKKEGLPFAAVLHELIRAGLDSLPGGGAEILVDRVREIISPSKATTDQWLEVMHEAHKANLVTSATMMFGHIESLDERIEHLIRIRELQNQKPVGSYGFLAFIPWPFQQHNTKLGDKFSINPVTMFEYIKFFALCRIMLNNISNLQPSLLTIGKGTAQVCLHAGGNDLGSVMIEENVVSAAGNKLDINKNMMQHIIREAGFIPEVRNQYYAINP